MLALGKYSILVIPKKRGLYHLLVQPTGVF